MFPSDHYFSDDEALMNQVEKAFETAEQQPKSIVLLGIEPDKAETSYGWIEPIDSMFSKMLNGVSQVKRFWEKPTFESAQYLLLKGCLWNSFVMVGKVSTFWQSSNANPPTFTECLKQPASPTGLLPKNKRCVHFTPG
ncbi:MAG: hypothetical protein HC846_04155 [Blastocatellia bacterium]|nr:hypothetical protein [Blastocatellia bacterium]